MKMRLLVIFLIILGILISGCVPKQEISGLLKYENKDLGIAFQYPSNFKVYQADENDLRIESDYKNADVPLMSIGMNIKRINYQRETYEQVENRFKSIGISIISKENKDNYELIKFGEGSQYYILSDKGTFYVGDSLETFGWKEKFKEEGIYQEYRIQLDQMRESIKII